jgi:dephospho-CoA kinase
LNQHYFSVGLTGGVGSGKSTVAGMLLRHGAGVVDADAIAHELTRSSGAAIEALRAAFGSDAITADGALDRVWMRRRAFSDPAARGKLEAVLHPLIRAASLDRAAQLVAVGTPYVVFVIPLLVESGNPRDRVDRLLVVDCSRATQLARVRQRPGLDEDLARGILTAQVGRTARLAAADDVVFNEAPLEEIETRVARLHRHYLRLAPTRARGGV